MHLRGFRLVLVIVALSLLLGALFFTPLSGFAQESTVEPTLEPTPVEPVGDEVSIPAWLLLNSAALFMALGSVAVLVTVAINRRDLKTALERADARSKDAVEAAYKALPDSAEMVVREFVVLARNMTEQLSALVKFVDEVTDGAPNSDPVGVGETAEVPRASPPPT